MIRILRSPRDMEAHIRVKILPTKPSIGDVCQFVTDISLSIDEAGVFNRKKIPRRRHSMPQLTRSSSGDLSAGNSPKSPKKNGLPIPWSSIKLQSKSTSEENAKETASGTAAAQGQRRQKGKETPIQTLRRSLSLGSKGSKDSAEASAASVVSSSSLPLIVGLNSALREKKDVHVSEDVPAHEVFSFETKYGQGGFGEVWLCRKKATSETFAVKRIPLKEADKLGAGAGNAARLHRELKVFQRLANPYIVKLHEVLMDADFLYLVMEECTGGDLAQYMENFQDTADRIMSKMEFPGNVLGLPSQTVGQLMWQMTAGLAYMHHHFFCHRDIKMQNYMIRAPARKPSDRPQLQLVDFGMSVKFRKGEKITGTVGTVKYMAPEVLTGQYNEKCDIWATGIVCYILCVERSPWGLGKTGTELAKYIREGWRDPWPVCDKPKSLKSVIDLMLDRNPETRPSAKQLLKTSRFIQKCSREGQGDSGNCCSIS